MLSNDAPFRVARAAQKLSCVCSVVTTALGLFGCPGSFSESADSRSQDDSATNPPPSTVDPDVSMSPDGLLSKQDISTRDLATGDGSRGDAQAFVRVYEAEDESSTVRLRHAIGRLDQDGWSAATGTTDIGGKALVHGPYATDGQ